MIVKYNKKFLRELADINKKNRNKIESFVFDDILKLTSIKDSGKIEKLRGYDNYYKIRFGDYRVGLKIKDDILTF